MGWTPTPRTVVRWKPETDDARELCCVTVRPAEARTSRALRRATPAFRERLRQWQHAIDRDDVESDRQIGACPTPQIPDEKGISPLVFKKRSNVWKYFRAYAATVLAVEILTDQRGVTILGTLIVCAAFLAASLSPALRYREPEEHHREAVH